MLKDVTTNGMDLASMLFNPNQSNPGKPGAAGNNRSQSFDQFMSDLESRNRDVPAPRESRPRDDRSANDVRRPAVNHNDHNRRTNGVNDRVQETAEDSQEALVPPVAESLPSEPENGQELAESEVVYEAAPVYEEAEEGEVEINEALIYVVAEVVQVPPEAVLEALEAQDIEPEELAEPKTANKFMQELLKVETPVELLKVPEYQDTLKDVVEAVEKFAETEAPPVKVATSSYERLAGYVATVDDQNQLVVSLEGEKPVEVEAIVAEEDLSLQLLEKGSDQPTGTRGTETAQAAQVSVSEEGVAVPLEASAEPLLQEAQVVNEDPQVNPVVAAAQQSAAAVQNVVDAAAPARVSPTLVMQQIVSHIKTISAENFAELRMTLRPENLGDVTLRIATQNGVVMAMFVAESQRIKEIIESQFSQLRDALAEQGIEVSELFVSVNSEDSEEQMNQFLKAQQEAIRRLQRASGISGEAVEEEEPAPIDPSLVLNNTVDFSA
jgi:flagellar hook-length control protein FliK